MASFDLPDDFSLAGSRASSEVFSGSDLLDVPPPQLPPPPSPLRALLEEHIPDMASEFFDDLEAYLWKLGITTVRQLAYLDRVHSAGRAHAAYRDTYDQAMDFFSSSLKCLQKAQFIDAIEAAHRATVPPAAPLPAPLPAPTSTPAPAPAPLPPPAPEMAKMTREVLAKRISDAFSRASAWEVPAEIWDAFFATVGEKLVLRDTVTLEHPPSSIHPRVGCPLCKATCSLFLLRNTWLVSTLCEHIRTQHCSTSAAALSSARPSPAAKRPGSTEREGLDARKRARADKYWDSVRQVASAATTSPVVAAAAPPVASLASRPGSSSVAVPAAPDPQSRS